MVNMSERIVKPTDPDALILEAWGQGFMVGSLIIMAAITVANMRSRTLLHKLIFAELVLGIAHGTFIFPHEPVYGWYLSVTAIGLNVSWALHNVIAWLKNRRFLSPKISKIYIITVILCWPYWILEIYANFTYFNNINDIFLKTRPLEPLFRDPWWVFTSVNLFWTIKSEYGFGIWEIIVVSPRFGIMFVAMILSIAFLVVDTCSVLNVFSSKLPTGVEPFWKLSFIFKCLSDAVILDDFKTALDHIRAHWMEKKNGDIFVTPSTPGTTPDSSPRTYRVRGDLESSGSLGYSCTAAPSTPTKIPVTRTWPADRIDVSENIRIQRESLETRHEERSRDSLVGSLGDGLDISRMNTREITRLSEDIPDIPLQRL